MSDEQTPRMVLPPPAPQSEAEGVQAGKLTPPFQFAQNPLPGGSEEGASRLHGDSTRNPINKQWTRSPAPRSR